jgi:hypothetical protein
MTGIRRTGKRALRGPCRDEVDVLYMLCSRFAICSFGGAGTGSALYQRAVTRLRDLLDTKSFGAACVGAITLGTGYVAGIGDSALLVVPLAVMIAYWLNIRQ